MSIVEKRIKNDQSVVQPKPYSRIDTLTERLFPRGQENISICRITKSLASHIKYYCGRLRKKPVFDQDGGESDKGRNYRAKSQRKPKELACSSDRQKFCPEKTNNHTLRGVLCNVRCVPDYEEDIDDYLRELEMKYEHASKNILGKPKEITQEMRRTLINWIVKAHSFYKFSQETLYLTVSIIDSYLRRKSVTLGRLQLLGLTAFYIAVKYEEGIHLEVRDLAHLTDKACVADDILKMELKVLKTLDFSLGKPLSVHFLNRLLLRLSLDGEYHFSMLSRYVLELTIFDDTLSSCRPSHLAAAALILAKNILFADDNNVRRLFAALPRGCSGNTKQELQLTVQKLKELWEKSSLMDGFFVIKSKYNHLNLSGVSSFQCFNVK